MERIAAEQWKKTLWNEAWVTSSAGAEGGVGEGVGVLEDGANCAQIWCTERGRWAKGQKIRIRISNAK